MVDILSHLSNVTHYRGEKWFAKCPTHDDRDCRSLEVELKHDKILLHCFSGCDTNRILKSMGLTMRDLFNNYSYAEDRKGRVPESYHDYRDLEGRLLYQAIRFLKAGGGKDFSQRRPNGRGGWDWGLGEVRRVLYRLPEVESMTAEFPNRIVFVVEGEKKADRLMGLGICATTTVCGSQSPWLPEYSAYLSDKHVAVLPDNDGPGLKYASAAIGSLVYHDVPSLRVVPLDVPEKGDVIDWLDADPNRQAALYNLVLNTPPWRRR